MGRLILWYNTYSVDVSQATLDKLATDELEMVATVEVIDNLSLAPSISTHDGLMSLKFRMHESLPPRYELVMRVEDFIQMKYIQDKEAINNYQQRERGTDG